MGTHSQDIVISIIESDIFGEVVDNQAKRFFALYATITVGLLPGVDWGHAAAKAQNCEDMALKFMTHAGKSFLGNII